MILSVNRSHEPWRVFEREALNKYFGPIIDARAETPVNIYSKYIPEVEYLRYHPHSENTTYEEYQFVINQTAQLPVTKFINHPDGFLANHCKDVAFYIWQQYGIPHPKYFLFSTKKDFYERLEQADFTYPFLIRSNNSTAGLQSYLISTKEQLDHYLPEILNLTPSGINFKLMCVEFIPTDHQNEYYYSYRVTVAGNSAISGYARITKPPDWIAIAGKFTDAMSNVFVDLNKRCEHFINKHEQLIVSAANLLKQNHTGIDIIETSSGQPIFLEVQHTYSTGYHNHPIFKPPYYNPYYPELVNFLQKNEQELKQEIPLYYNNWLNKENHFDLAYKSLKQQLG